MRKAGNARNQYLLLGEKLGRQGSNRAGSGCFGGRKIVFEEYIIKI